MTRFVEARMHLGVEITGAGRHPGAAAWTGQDPAALAGPRHVLTQVGTAAGRGLDLVALGGPDAVALATRVAPAVGGIGLVPAVAPGEAAAQVAALDVVSAGRAGWEVAGPVSDDEIAAVVERWATGGGGAIGPRSPQGRPPLVLRAADGDDPATVARWADVVRISAPDLAAAREARVRLRAAVADAGRDPGTVPVLLDVEVHLAADAHRARADVTELDAVGGVLAASSVRVLGGAGAVADLIGTALRLDAVDGVVLVPLVLPTDLRRVTEDLVPLLAWRGLFRPGRSGTLRARLGLAGPHTGFRRASA